MNYSSIQKVIPGALVFVAVGLWIGSHNKLPSQQISSSPSDWNSLSLHDRKLSIKKDLKELNDTSENIKQLDQLLNDIKNGRKTSRKSLEDAYDGIIKQQDIAFPSSVSLKERKN